MSVILINQMKKISVLLLLLVLTFNSFAQIVKNDTLQQSNNTQFKYQALIIPTALVGYGIVGIESRALKNINSDINERLQKQTHKIITIDDYSQYAPFVSVYALNAIGVKGKNNFKDRTIILGTAYLIMGGTVNIIKATVNVKRPDGSTNNSFPSGHTATAFMGAELLYQEYKDVSVWYGISGYLVASGTGFFRMYNNRHWLTDVAAGAGIGILSTKVAYWIHPFIKRTIFKDKGNMCGVVMPFYNGKEYGLGLSMMF